MKRVALLFVLVLTGCGGGASSRQAAQFNIVGHWHVLTLADSSGQTSCPGATPDNRMCTAGDYWDLKADGTFHLFHVGSNENGIYRFTQPNLLEFSGGGGSWTPYLVTGSGQTMTATLNDGGEPISRTFERQ